MKHLLPQFPLYTSLPEKLIWWAVRALCVAGARFAERREFVLDMAAPTPEKPWRQSTATPAK